MELSPLGRRLVFGLIVCVLVGLGAYLIGPVARGAGKPAGKPTSAPSATAPSRQVAPAARGPDDIYQWLPFTQAGLTAAASVAVRFGNAYGSYSYTQTPTAYAATLGALAAPQLVSQIEAAYSAPGVASARVSTKQVAVGAATIASIRGFGPTSITFLVQVAQRLAGTSGSSTQTTVYAVTVTGSGMSWQVTDVELASSGNS